jgi:hypothetical protein
MRLASLPIRLLVVSTVLLVVVLGGSAVPAVAAEIAAGAASVLGPTTGQPAGGAVAPEFRDLEYWENHDGTFENAYAWRVGGIGDPYFGAFAEGYHGPVMVRGIRVYMTQIGFIEGETMDLFVWTAGIGEPGAVVAIVPEVRPNYEEIPYWPEVGGQDFEIGASVGPNFYVGARGNFGIHVPWWYGADVGERGGSPWTCIAPGLGYTTGWNHPDIVFGEPTQSMGFGVYVETAQGIEDLPEGEAPARTTWGRIKQLCR